MYEQFVTVTTVLQRRQEGTSPFGPLSLRSDQRGNIFRNIARATTKNLTLSVPLLRPGYGKRSGKLQLGAQLGVKDERSDQGGALGGRGGWSGAPGVHVPLPPLKMRFPLKDF